MGLRVWGVVTGTLCWVGTGGKCEGWHPKGHCCLWEVRNLLVAPGEPVPTRPQCPIGLMPGERVEGALGVGFYPSPRLPSLPGWALGSVFLG